MDEAEVAEAYRDRFLREMASLQPVAEGSDGAAFPDDIESHIHRGLGPADLALWREAEAGPAPGWMSVVVVPLPPRPQLLNPTRDATRFQTALQIPERWDVDHWPLEFFRRKPSSQGLVARLPERDDVAPAYILAMHRDGLMEFGTTLTPGLRHENPEDNRVIFGKTHPNQAHDYLQGFAVALDELGYDGAVGAQVSFEHTEGVRLGVPSGPGLELRRILHEDHIRSNIWRDERSELPNAAGLIVKEVSDLL